MLSNIFHKESDKRTAQVNLVVMAIFSFFALLAAFQLSVDKLYLAEHPDAKLLCSINLVVNCAPVMETPQASVFGFPNSFIGIAGFSVLFFFAISSLLGVRYNKAMLKLLFGGISAAWLFALWLFFNSVYVIQILCPWCLLTTLSTTIVFATTLRIGLLENILNFDKKQHKTIRNWLRKDYDRLFFAIFLVTLTLLIVIKFGDALIG